MTADELRDAADVGRFLQSVGLNKSKERAYAKVVKTLAEGRQATLYALYTKGSGSWVCAKATVYKIKRLFEEGKLTPYVDYLVSKGEINRQAQQEVVSTAPIPIHAASSTEPKVDIPDGYKDIQSASEGSQSGLDEATGSWPGRVHITQDQADQMAETVSKIVGIEYSALDASQVMGVVERAVQLAVDRYDIHGVLTARLYDFRVTRTHSGYTLEAYIEVCQFVEQLVKGQGPTIPALE